MAILTCTRQRESCLPMVVESNLLRYAEKVVAEKLFSFFKLFNMFNHQNINFGKKERKVHVHDIYESHSYSVLLLKKKETVVL